MEKKRSSFSGNGFGCTKKTLLSTTLVVMIGITLYNTLIMDARAGCGMSELSPHAPQNFLRNNTYRMSFWIFFNYPAGVDVKIMWWFNPLPEPLIVVWDQPPPVNATGTGAVERLKVYFNLTVPSNAPVKVYHLSKSVHVAPIGSGISCVVTMFDEIHIVGSPEICIVSPQEALYASTCVPLSFKITTLLSISWIGYSLDNQPNVTINGNTILNVEDGSHQILLYANDTSGNMGSSGAICFTVSSSLFNPWETSFIGLDDYPIIDLVECNGSLYATSKNLLYVFNGERWDAIEAPTHTLSLECYEGQLVVGGKDGIYTFTAAGFNQVVYGSAYYTMLGAYNNTLYAGTLLDKPPTLYYCNGSAENPANWYIDTGFSTILNFSGPFGSIDAFCVYDNLVNPGNPVGHWKFDEGLGSIAYDSSENQNDGMIVGCTYTNNVPRPSANFALAFNNTLGAEPADSYVMIPDSPSLRLSSALTIQAWINASQAGGKRMHIVAKESGPSTNDSYALWYNWDGYLYFGLMSTPIASVRTEFPAMNVWHHVAGVWDGSIMRLYVDGDEVANKSFAGPLVYDSNPVLIGADDQDGDDIPEEGWIGLIDDVRIYDYARTAEQILNDCVGIGEIYIASGDKVCCYNGTAWNIAKTFDDVCIVLDMQVYNGRLYLATRDQGWRKPMCQGGTGFSGRVIEYDGENWTTILDHNYWIFSLETYNSKLYAGTANKIFTYNGTDWETSFSSEEGAYYAISLMTFDNKIYAGMGNGCILVDPSPGAMQTETVTVPEFHLTITMPISMVLTVVVTLFVKGKKRKIKE